MKIKKERAQSKFVKKLFLLFDVNVLVAFDHVDVALELFHFGFDFLLSLLLWCRVGDYREALVAHI